MKNFFKMTIVAIAMVVSVSANAQTRVHEMDSISVSEAKTYASILRSNPADTLRAIKQTADTTFVYSCFLRGGEMVFKTEQRPIVRNVVTVPNVAQLNALDTARVVRTFFHQTKEDRGVDQTYYVYTDENGLIRTIPKKDISKDGLHIGARGGYVLGDGYKGPAGFISLGYYQPKWFVEASVGYGYSKYSRVAVDFEDQSYGCYKLEAIGGFTPLQLKADKFDQHRVSLFGGVGFNLYETKSQVSENAGLRSKGWTPYPTAGVEYKYRPFQWGTYFSIRYQAGADVMVLQNGPLEFDFWHQISVGVQFNLTRHGGKR